MEENNGVTDASVDIVSKDIARTYREDGVVLLKGAFDASWIDLAVQGIERNLAQPGPFFRDQTPPGETARYVFDYWTWQHIPEFQTLIVDSPASRIAAHLMGCNSVSLLMDNWFMNEAGTMNAAPWHQDEPYFDYTGTMCNLLVILDPAPAEQSLRFIKGSHHWGKLFKAVHFRDHIPFDGQSDTDYGNIGDIDPENAQHDIANWNVEAGDCIAFDLRTLHRGPIDSSPAESTRKRFSLRFGGPDTTFTPRGSWTAEITQHLNAQGQKPDERIDTPLTPVIQC